MQADGALQPRLDAWLEGQKVWANALANSKNPIVPAIVMGGSADSKGTNGIEQFMKLMAANQARELGVKVQSTRPGK